MNTAIITINSIKTITMPVISHFIKAIIMFVNKGKINTTKFLCCIMRNLQKNLNIMWQSRISRQTNPLPIFALPSLF